MKGIRTLIGSLVLAVSLMFAPFPLTGCAGGGTEIHTGNTTMGKELSDLQEAYEKGIITEKEYKQAKKDILRKYR